MKIGGTVVLLCLVTNYAYSRIITNLYELGTPSLHLQHTTHPNKWKYISSTFNYHHRIDNSFCLQTNENNNTSFREQQWQCWRPGLTVKRKAFVRTSPHVADGARWLGLGNIDMLLLARVHSAVTFDPLLRGHRGC